MAVNKATDNQRQPKTASNKQQQKAISEKQKTKTSEQTSKQNSKAAHLVFMQSHFFSNPTLTYGTKEQA